MLLHLPIAILATVSPIVVSETVPKFDIAKECRFESESSKTLDRCSHDEAEALQQLQAEWLQFVDADRRVCLAASTGTGFASYVELLICLEMARDVRNGRTDPRDSLGRTGPQSMPPNTARNDAVDKRD